MEFLGFYGGLWGFMRGLWGFVRFMGVYGFHGVDAVYGG